MVPSCLRDLPGDTGSTVDTSTYVGTYQPVYYAAVGWPTLLFPPDSGVLVARIVSALIVAALLASALTTMATFGGAVSVAATMLAITPAFIYLMGVVNPSGIEIAASLALWSTLLALFSDPRAPRRVVVRAAVAAVCLIAVRPLSPAIAVAIVASVVIVAADRDGSKELWARRSVPRGIAGHRDHAVRQCDLSCWRPTPTTRSSSAWPRSSGLPSPWPANALGNTWALSQEQVGLLGPLGGSSQRAPAAFVDGWLVLVLALVVLAMVVGTPRRRAGLALILVGSLGTPVLAAVANPTRTVSGSAATPCRSSSGSPSSPGGPSTDPDASRPASAPVCWRVCRC